MIGFPKIRLLPTCLIVSILVTACGNNNKQIIEDHFNALNRHNVKLLVKNYDPDVEVTSSGWAGIHNGTREMMFDYARYFHETPDLKYDIANAYFSGDSIVTVEYTTSGTVTNTEKNTPLAIIGKKYILNNCTIFTIRNSRIVKEATYFDQFAFLKQMGLFDQQQ